MVSIDDPKEQKDIDDKDDKSSRSLPDDEENALPTGDQVRGDSVSKEQDSSEPQPESKDEDVIPNGGMAAWLQVLGSFMLFFNTFGILK